MESSGVTNNVLKLILNSNFIKSPSAYLLMVSHFSYNIDLKAYAPTCVGSFFLHALSLWNSIAYKDSNSMMIGLTAVMKTLLKFGLSEKHTKFKKNLPYGFDIY